MSLTVLIPERSPRLTYTIDLLLGRWLGLDYQVTTNPDQYRTADGPWLHYGSQRIHHQEVLIPISELLFESGIQAKVVPVRWQEEIPFFFGQSTKTADFPFDFFALAFFCLSRYEEYLPFSPDLHGRFDPDESLAGRHGFLQFPVVDAWMDILREKLMERFPELSPIAPTYHFHPTYDVDLAWAYLHRRPWRTLGSLARDLLSFDSGRIGERLAVWSGRRADPYFTFPHLDALHQAFQLNPIFFFLLSEWGPHDRGISPMSPALQQLIRRLASQYQIGIHPSYQSNQQAAKLATEIHQLEQIIGRPVKYSRQHYLRLHFPHTYHRLLMAGITHDYTMGYASRTGFRAGTARSFPWYDLNKEETTLLIVHPFQVMDVTLKQYLRLSPDQAFEEVRKLMEVVRRYGGTFRTLWHNSSFAEREGWAGWRAFYQSLLSIASK